MIASTHHCPVIGIGYPYNIQFEARIACVRVMLADKLRIKSCSNRLLMPGVTRSQCKVAGNVKVQS